MSTHTVLYLSKALARAATDTLNYSPIRIIRSNIGHNSIGSKRREYPPILLKQSFQYSPFISVSYGQRWIVESVFSSLKTMFAEYVSARRFPNLVKEIMLNASFYTYLSQ
jgi:hypothetical protein